MGQKIDDIFYKQNPEMLKAITPPKSSDDAREIYNFITENPYTINRGVGMGADVTIAPDMSKIIIVADKEGIDAYTYKDFFLMFVNKQREEEEKFKDTDKNKQESR